MSFSPYLLAFFSTIISLIASSNCRVSAQVIPDNSLGNENSVVTPNVTINNKIADLIEGGAIRGENLFHSFLEFNINNGSKVYFANPDGITNILTRVTGNNISEIFGTLGVNGTANLFLLNPNGIVFGENAALDINGSFLATTADSYIFNNGFAYSASNPEVPPLLTVNIPLGVQFGDRAASIINRSQFINSPLSNTEESNEATDFFSIFRGLQVSSGQNMTLIGGDLILEGGNLSANSGQIELGSVAPASFVGIQTLESGWTLNYDLVNLWQDVVLNQEASINSSGNGGGSLQIRARNLHISGNSGIYNVNLGERMGTQTTIITSESIELIGDSTDLENPTAGIIDFSTYSTGDGGDVLITTQALRLTNGSQIANGTRGAGNGGNLAIQAQEIEIKGVLTFKNILFPELNEFISIPAGIFTLADSNTTGNAGNLTLDSEKITVSDSAQINTTTIGSGKGGNLIINAKNLSLDNRGIIATGTFGAGDSGNMSIEVSESLKINGSDILKSNIEDRTFLVSSGLYTTVQPGSTGNGGNLTVEAGSIELAEGGEISASTRGQGNAGNISINAQEIVINSTVTELEGINSGISSSVGINAQGNANNIEIVTNSLKLIDGGSIFAGTMGAGNAGNITITAEDIDIRGTSTGEPVKGIAQKIVPSQISAFSHNNFAAGSISIQTDRLQVRDSGEISVSNQSQGNSGNLQVTAREISLANNGMLNALVNYGDRGNITLNTQNLTLNQNSKINTSGSGTATGGNITINNQDNIVLFDRSQIIADALQGNGGKIEIHSQGLFAASENNISASSQFGLDGTVKIITINRDRKSDLTQLPEQPFDATQQITANCGMGINNFAIVGRGSLPENPVQSLRGQTVWQDLRLPVKQKPMRRRRKPSLGIKKPIIAMEAQSWKINQQGNIELVSAEKIAKIEQSQFSCLQ